MSADHIWSNAKRLLEDAKLLASNERYSSAMALAVLSAEEIGKYYMLKWSSDASDLRSHHAKQRAFGSLLMASILADKIDDFVRCHGYEIKHHSELSEWQRTALESNEVRKFNEQFYSGELKDVTSGEQLISIMSKELKGVPLSDEIMSGKLNEWKKTMFYVDFDRPASEVDVEKLKMDTKTVIGQIQLIVEKLNKEK